MSPRPVTLRTGEGFAHPSWRSLEILRRGFDDGVLAEIATVMHQWSHAETELVGLAARCLSADHEPIAMMLGQVKNSRTLMNWVKTVVTWTVVEQDAAIITTFLETRLEPIRLLRNDLAHSLWCRYRADPTCVVIVHPSQVTFAEPVAHLRSIEWDARDNADEALYEAVQSRMASLRNPRPGAHQGLLYTKRELRRANLKANRELRTLSFLPLLAQPDRVPTELVRLLLSKGMRAPPYVRTPTIRRPQTPPPQSPDEESPPPR